MRFQRVMLVKPVYYKSHYDCFELSAGLGYISEALSRAGISNTVVDMRLGYDIEALGSRMKEFKPDLIGISMMSFGYKRNYQLITDIKKSFPTVGIVVAGPHLSTLRRKVLDDCPSIDYGVTLEGEETIVELCRGDIPIHQIKGLLYKDEAGRVVYTGDRNFIKDLDGNRFPTYSQFELHRYPNPISIPVVTSRGCPYGCIYCPVHLAIGRSFRFRSPASVADEFEYWYAKGYRVFDIVDDNFTLLQDRVFSICDELERRHLTGLEIRCGNGIRADRVNRELLQRMREVGFCYLAFGVEGGNDKVLKRLKKAEDIATIERAIKTACKLGLQVTLFFLLGSPGETKADVKDSVNLALKYPVYDVRFYNLIPFPHTELYDWIATNQYFIKEEGDYLADASHWVNDPIFETPELPAEERKRLYRWANDITKWHTLRVKAKFHCKSVSQEFQRMGFPTWASHHLTNIYFTGSFQRLFVESGLTRKAKKFLSSLRGEG